MPQAGSERVPVWRQVWGWVYPIVVGIAIALILRRWVVDAAIVPTPSMDPTIPAPSYILVNKLATEFGTPYRGEVVVFHFPDDPSQIYVKRIIGLPGDTVTVTEHAVYVNGKQLYEPYIHVSNGSALGTYHVPPGCYFMMGDNRPVSYDSRLWVHHYVSRSAIIGQAEFVIFPLSQIHHISQ
ncbi:MAG: signal peptidase I [Alicyclobacillaceae bacterium]|nr:signal peptidase I [Alicyclobacillaceae bacterium]